MSHISKKPKRSSTKWFHQEDIILHQLHKQMGKDAFRVIQNILQRRTSKQAKNRWNHSSLFSQKNRFDLRSKFEDFCYEEWKKKNKMLSCVS
jgi:hypothetical protein